MLRPVKEVPKPQHRGRESYVAADVREFLRAGMQAAAVEHKGKNAIQIGNALTSFFKHHPDMSEEVGHVVRGGASGTCYLFRKEKEKQEGRREAQPQ